MFRKLCVFCVFILIILLASCGTKPTELTNEKTTKTAETQTTPDDTPILPTKTPVSGDFKYHNVLGDGNDDFAVYSNRVGNTYLFYDHALYLYDGARIMKCDFLIGSTWLPACADPGCTHDKEGCISYAVPTPANLGLAESPHFCFHFGYNNALYFSVGPALCKYQLDNAKLTQIARFPGNSSITAHLADGKIIVMCRASEQESNEEDPLNYGNSLYSVDSDGGKTAWIADMGKEYVEFPFAYGGRMYFLPGNATPDSGIPLVSTDLSYSDRKTEIDIDWLHYRHMNIKNGKLFYSEITGFDSRHAFRYCNIVSRDLNTGEDTVICTDQVMRYFVTNKYIYYTVSIDEGISHECFRIDHDGSGKEKVFEINDLDDAIWYIDDMVVDGDYMIASAIFYIDGQASYRYISIDLTTGAWRYINSEDWYN